MKKNPFILDSLGIASIFVCTSIFLIPVGMWGYITIGDAMIMLFASVSYPLHAFFIGAIGSFLADLIFAPSYAIFTFFIKGAEAMIIAFLCKRSKKTYFIPFLIGGLAVIIGYACTDIFLTSQIISVFPSMGINSFQIGICILIAMCLTPLFHRFYHFYKR